VEAHGGSIDELPPATWLPRARPLQKERAMDIAIVTFSMPMLAAFQ
jgi:hypothetical protein